MIEGVPEHKRSREWLRRRRAGLGGHPGNGGPELLFFEVRPENFLIGAENVSELVLPPKWGARPANHLTPNLEWIGRREKDVPHRASKAHPVRDELSVGPPFAGEEAFEVVDRPIQIPVEVNDISVGEWSDEHWIELEVRKSILLKLQLLYNGGLSDQDVGTTSEVHLISREQLPRRHSPAHDLALFEDPYAVPRLRNVCACDEAIVTSPNGNEIVFCRHVGRRVSPRRKGTSRRAKRERSSTSFSRGEVRVSETVVSLVRGH
jgi:hypothetical protein